MDRKIWWIVNSFQKSGTQIVAWNCDVNGSVNHKMDDWTMKMTPNDAISPPLFSLQFSFRSDLKEFLFTWEVQVNLRFRSFWKTETSPDQHEFQFAYSHVNTTQRAFTRHRKWTRADLKLRLVSACSCKGPPRRLSASSKLNAERITINTCLNKEDHTFVVQPSQTLSDDSRQPNFVQLLNTKL